MIRLTRTDADGNKRALFINPAHIVSLEGADKCCVTLTTGFYWVDHSADEIVILLRDVDDQRIAAHALGGIEHVLNSLAAKHRDY